MFENDYILSVTQLNEYVAAQLKNDILLGNIGVRGEISGLVKHSSGHIFFSLKDENALVRCTMFKSYADNVRYKLDLKDGMQVVVKGSAMLYVKDGQFRINVRAIEKEGSGAIFENFLKLKEKLEKEGLFDEKYKRPIPFLPKCVGVVTSPTGAALQDILNITYRRFPKMNICLCPTAVQGNGAAEEIASAILYMNKINKCDVMIVGRGGGSLEDLWAFNEEVVARAIFESEIPIVSAVGHETDFSISDFVADMRAPTPSAAAELCVPLYESISGTVNQYDFTIRNTVKNNIALRRQRLDSITSSAVLSSPLNALSAFNMKVENCERIMDEAVKSALNIAKEKYFGYEKKLEALSPYGVLERGYAAVKNSDGEFVLNTKGFDVGDVADIMMSDGNIKVTVEEITRFSK
ncbi:MAG: exodeoxyribonuclease VII large subunit [Clostridia bacterium]|nr:exodeoxyribonuclease VII large subunit [Clostridia bacterium]